MAGFIGQAFSHPVRVKIMGLLAGGDRALSPNQMAREFGEPLGNVSYHVRQLHGLGVLELARQRQVRGAVEHFYRLRLEAGQVVVLAFKASRNGAGQ